MSDFNEFDLPYDHPPLSAYESEASFDGHDTHQDLGGRYAVERNSTPAKVGYLENELKPMLQIPEDLRGTVIGRLAARVAYCLEFPEASAFMAILASASASVATNYATQYVTGTSVATGLYAIIEQPPATQKSFLLGIGMNPYAVAISEHNKRIRAMAIEAKERAKKDEKVSVPKYAFTNTTDATSAALDKALSSCSEGRFVVASAEQSALISLFPEGNSFSSTNELILKGYPGEYVSGLRNGREAFSGIAQGAIVLVAQPGSAKRILGASEGSGMAERFFFLSEPTMLGMRRLSGEYPAKSEMEAFSNACKACVKGYSDRIFEEFERGENGLVLDPENLIQIRASENGYQMIMTERRNMEPELGELAMKGDMVLLSWLGKLETHALKAATVIHVIESLATSGRVERVLPDDLLAHSIDLVRIMGEHIKTVLHTNGESGEAAEVAAVMAIFDEKPRSLAAAVAKLKNRTPFKKMPGGGHKPARRRIEKMIATGVLMIDAKSNIRIV